jgi:membrane-bound metal-dependent hydrolase YbcI (DUF457 family)
MFLTLLFIGVTNAVLSRMATIFDEPNFWDMSDPNYSVRAAIGV